ncbi:hypothetical protein POTOM_050555 [Populus tomentosa]|uniref:CRAL-TRIO domain-containing protein n=1 Tax=Populus tomentosa TaxID=118781 RepID=A0A8X7YCF2_POPTO|nr:hypothetical protein POTOM_050555 [Populus tomentosa]
MAIRTCLNLGRPQIAPVTLTKSPSRNCKFSVQSCSLSSNQSQKQLVVEVKEKLGRDYHSLPVGKNGRDDEEMILWFLKDRKFSVDEAVSKLTKAIKWREEFKVSELSEESVKSIADTGKAYVHDSLDVYGKPVLIVVASKHLPAVHDPVEDEKLCVFLIEKALRKLTAGKEQILGIIDLRGFSTRNADLKFLTFLGSSSALSIETNGSLVWLNKMSLNDRELKEDTYVAGYTLHRFPSFMDLLYWLDRLVNGLVKVDQFLSSSMRRALSPTTKALVAKELLMGIATSNDPYTSNISNRVAHKCTWIFEIIVRIKLYLVTLDLKCDSLVMDMLRCFVESFTDNYSKGMFFHMNDNLTECEEIKHDQSEFKLEDQEVVVKVDDCIEDDMEENLLEEIVIVQTQDCMTLRMKLLKQWILNKKISFDVFYYYYPKRLGQVLFVEAPFIFKPIWQVAKPLLRSYTSLVRFCPVETVRKEYFTEETLPASFREKTL